MRLWKLRKVVLNLSFRLGSLVRGGRFRNLVPLAGLTIEKSDLRLARRLLKQRTSWHDYKFADEYHRVFCDWNGSKFAYSFSSGRAAFRACLTALQLRPGDEVIIPGYTCVVVDNAVRHLGYRPVYCDIELETYGLDYEKLRELISEKTKAILIQHLYGLVSRDYESIVGLAKGQGISVIEDCAHATGAMYKNRRVGNLGDLAFYSSEQSKVFSTVQGGIATTNCPILGKRLQGVWQNAQPASELHTQSMLYTLVLIYYQHSSSLNWMLGDIAALLLDIDVLPSTSEIEVNGGEPPNLLTRLSPALAQIAINQIRKLDEMNERRRSTALEWERWCKLNGYCPATVIRDSEPVFLRYPILVEPERKTDRQWAAKTLGVELGVWFLGSMHPRKEIAAGCQNASEAVARCINFPCLK